MKNTTLESLTELLLSSRQEGHTTALVDGAKNTPNTIMLVGTLEQQACLRKQGFEGKILPISALTNMGMSKIKGCPIVLDHTATLKLLAIARGAIQHEEDRVERIKYLALKLQDV